MERQQPQIVLVGKPGHMRDALSSLIHTHPDIPQITAVENGAAALQVIQSCAADLVVITSGLPDQEVLDLIYNTRQQCPRTHCLVLSEKAGLQASALIAGASSAMPAGLPVEQLFTAIQKILAEYTPFKSPSSPAKSRCDSNR